MSGDIGDQKEAKRSQRVAKFFCASKRKKKFSFASLHLSETLKCEAKQKQNGSETCQNKLEKERKRKRNRKAKKIKLCVAFENVSPTATPAALKRVCPTAACAASGRFCPTAACAAFLPLDMSVLLQPVLPLDVFVLQQPSNFHKERRTTKIDYGKANSTAKRRDLR